MLRFNSSLLVLPLDAEWRVRDDIVEFVALELVVREGVAVFHILCITALDKHICLGDSEGLLIQLLTEFGKLCILIYGIQLLREAIEHLTRSHSHIIHCGCDALLKQCVLLGSNENLCHKVDNVTGSEVGSCVLVV